MIPSTASFSSRDHRDLASVGIASRRTRRTRVRGLRDRPQQVDVIKYKQTFYLGPPFWNSDFAVTPDQTIHTTSSTGGGSHVLTVTDGTDRVTADYLGYQYTSGADDTVHLNLSHRHIRSPSAVIHGTY